MDSRQEAQGYLTILRENPDRWFACYNLLKYTLKQGALSLADIGTSEEEIAKLQAANRKHYAHAWLVRLRKESSRFDLRALWECIEDGGFSLEDIGTSKEEVERFRIEDCKGTARFYLKQLREHSSFFALRLVREEVKSGGFSLKDIGTSEEEIQEFCKQMAEPVRMDMRKYLNRAEFILGIVERASKKMMEPPSEDPA